MLPLPGPQQLGLAGGSIAGISTCPPIEPAAGAHRKGWQRPRITLQVLVLLPGLMRRQGHSTAAKGAVINVSCCFGMSCSSASEMQGTIMQAAQRGMH
jgi:hypothetical protein